MDLRELREQTRPEHEATEAAMPLMVPHLSLSTYSGVLRVLLPVLQSWELWSATHAPLTARPLLAARQRSHLIADDLRCLGEAEAGIEPAAPDRIDWTSVVKGTLDADTAPQTSQELDAAFFGAFYVLEGSTLGGRFIARHVQASLRLRPGCGDTYFKGHGENTARIWRETQAVIAAVPDADAPFVTEAAKRTFRAFGAALSAFSDRKPEPASARN